MEREDDRGAPASGALHTARVDKRNKLGGMDGNEVLTLAASVTVDAQGSASDTYIASSSTTGDGVANEGAMSAVEVFLIFSTLRLYSGQSACQKPELSLCCSYDE